MIRNLAVSTIAVATILGVTLAEAACGTRGGPGYRGPNGKCVGWAQIGRVCGNPPTLRCTAEREHPDAATAAGLGQKIEGLRPMNRQERK